MKRILYRLIKRKIHLEQKYWIVKGELEGINNQIQTIQEYTNHVEKNEDMKYERIIHNRD